MKTGQKLRVIKRNNYLTSVDKIEELTGYDFLSNLPKPLQDALEAKVDSGRAPSQSQVTGPALGLWLMRVQNYETVGFLH